MIYRLLSLGEGVGGRGLIFIAMEKILALNDVSLKMGGRSILKNIHLIIHAGEHWAIVGESGSGKSMLADALQGKVFFHGNISLKEGTRLSVIPQFQQLKNLSNTTDFYYQQRYNSYDSANTVTVKEWLGEETFGQNHPGHEYIQLLGLVPLADEPLIQLSNGEQKRLQLARTLMEQPDILVLDQPYIGLDVDARNLLNEILNHLTSRGITLVLLSSGTALPAFIDHVALLENGELTISKDVNYATTQYHDSNSNLEESLGKAVTPFQRKIEEAHFEWLVRMKNVNLEYEGHAILRNVNWQVRKGERWRIAGKNGSGKTSLLSLLTGDNPQAYANEIFLFDRKRGSGETIWEIKSRIGFVSPELHQHFDKFQTVHDTIASGLFDTIGLFRPISSEQEESTRIWERLFGLEPYSNHVLKQLPASLQRMALIARALVKYPPVLILDEPMQGLDPHQVGRVKKLINHLCRETDITVLYVSHYTEDIPEVIDQVLEMVKPS